MRLEIPVAYASRKIDGWIVTVRLGEHSLDTEWVGWQPWDPLADPLDRPLDGAHPSLTWERPQ